jgi:hypothetical protein
MTFRRLLLALFLLVLFRPEPAPAQQPNPPTPGDSRPEVRLPNGRLQRDAIVKADHARNIEDAEKLVKLAEDLKDELTKNTEFVLSVSSIKKTEEIEKLARTIRNRLKRY